LNIDNKYIVRIYDGWFTQNTGEERGHQDKGRNLRNEERIE